MYIPNKQQPKNTNCGVQPKSKPIQDFFALKFYIGNLY